MSEIQYKVLHVIKRLDVVGGAERIVAELLLKEPGFDVLVYGGEESFFNLGDRKVIRAKNIMHALWLCLKWRSRYLTYHLHLFPSIYFALILGKKAIIHEHNTHNARRNYIVFKPIEWLVYRRARSVLAISNAAKVALHDWLGSSLDINVLTNFVAPISKINNKNRVSNKSDSKHIVMVASFTLQKRQDFLIESLVHLPDDVTLTSAGSGPTLVKCKELAVRLEVANRVAFLGNVSDVAALYATADLCILLSHWEGFGLVVVEAAQCGIPTLVSDVEGLRDICPDPNLLFKGHEPRELAVQIEKLLNFSKNDEYRINLVNYALKFGIDEYLTRLKQFYVR